MKNLRKCLAVLLVVSMLTPMISVYSNARTSDIDSRELKIAGASLTLQSNLTLNYKVKKSLFDGTNFENPYILFEMNGVQSEVRDYTENGEYYVFRFENIALNQLNDTIKATLCAEARGALLFGDTVSYSVAAYCYNMLGKCAGGAYAQSIETPQGTRMIFPTDFSDIPVSVYKNGAKYMGMYDFSQHDYENHIYIDHELGSDATGDGTAEHPFKTVKKAVASTNVDTTFHIQAQKPFLHGEMPAGMSLDYNASFKNENADGKKIVMTCGNGGLHWTADGNLFRAARVNIKSVIMKNDFEPDFGWSNLTQVDTKELCRETPNSWYTDNKSVWVNSDTMPTDDTCLACTVTGENVFYPKAGKSMFFEGFVWIGVPNGDAVLFADAKANTATAKVFLKNCAAGLNCGEKDGKSLIGNGFAFDNIREAVLQNCIAKNSRRDGFNYHWSTAKNASECYVAEIDCRALKSGLFDASTNNNGSTIHNAGRILRVNTVAQLATGAPIADVNGTKSLMYNCVSKDGTIAYGMLFDMAPSGWAALYDCSSDKDLNATGGTIYLDNFNGAISKDSTAEVVDAKLRTLLVDLLNYGAQAQLYTNYHTENLVTANLTEEQVSFGASETPMLSSKLNTQFATIENPTVQWRGAGLVLGNAVTMRFMLAAEDITNLRVRVHTAFGEWYIPYTDFVRSNGAYYVYFSELNAVQMREPIYLTVYDENMTAVSHTVCYSIESYAYAKQDSALPYLADLVKAMMKYGDSAYAYIQ